MMKGRKGEKGRGVDSKKFSEEEKKEIIKVRIMFGMCGRIPLC